ncbi:uncharacterized protein LOC139914034 [Centroberyx gerrardi]
MHQCPDCPKSFPSASKLQRHHLIHTGQKPFTCTVCGKSFTQSEHLKTHSQKVHHAGPSTDRILPQEKKSSSVSSQAKRKRDILPLDIWLPSSEIEAQPQVIPRVNDGLMIQSSISTDGSLFMDPIPQDKVGSTAMDTSVCNTHNGYTCSVCLKSFSSPLQLWIHSPVHKKAEQYESEICGQTFSKKGRLRMHSQSHERGSYRGKVTLKHQCATCLKSFCSPSKLKRHFLIHTGQKPFSCMICKKAFRQETHLKSHLITAKICSQSQSTERKTQKFCNDSQTSGVECQSSLLQHPSSHDTAVNSSVELELQCKVSVSAAQDLGKSEIKSEEAIKPGESFNGSSQHQKSVCLETLNKSVEHEQHYLTHKDSKPFRCATCDRSFHLEVNLIRHQDIHKNQKGLRSHTTAEDMRNNVSQSAHMKSEAITNSPEPNHADPLDLDIIVKSETWSENCIDHSDSPLQDVKLTTSPDQRRVTHQATDQQQRINTLCMAHQCHACSKNFPSLSKLQRHMLTHTGQRPFGCQMCGKRFRQKTHLRVHCRTHLWSKYHKQRSLYISRPPSRIARVNTKLAADVPVREMFVDSKHLEKNSGIGLLSEKRLARAPSQLSVWNDNNRELPFLLPTSQKNDVVQLSKVSKVTVKKRQTAKAMQNPSNMQHKCFQCFKCFPSASKLQRHEMVHTGLKPFQCLMCGKTFRQAPHLKVHEQTHYKRRPLKPVHQQGKISKLKVKSQQQLYPRINIHIPLQKNSMRIDTVHSQFADALNNQGKTEQFSPRREIAITKVNNLTKTRIKNKVAYGNRKAHMCRICCKAFATPYKLSRHLLTHSGIRPYKCCLCSKTFTQLSHLKVHERSHRHDNRTSDCVQGEMIRTNHLQDKYLDNGPAPETFMSAHFNDCKEDVVSKQPQSHYTSAGHYLVTDGVFSHCSEATDTEWLAVPEVALLEENMESEKTQRENCNQAPELYSRSSFPYEHASETHRLVQNQKAAGPPSSQQEKGSIPVMANSDSYKMLSEGLVSSVVENQIQADFPDYYWCEPLIMFECDKCTGSFETEQDLQRHKCNTRGQPKMAQSVAKYHCDICFKKFVSPSKLERHYLIHTGQRPFRCDVCGKTFTQLAHVRTHQRTH